MTREEFIKDMISIIEEVTTSDLQGMVAVRCMASYEDENELLNDIYNGAGLL